MAIKAKRWGISRCSRRGDYLSCRSWKFGYISRLFLSKLWTGNT